MYRTTANMDILLPLNNSLREHVLALADKKLFSHALKNSFDLFPVFSVLVSSVWNENTDVFDKRQIWRARHSPEDKPLNWMHSQNEIIGHIVDNVCVDANFNPIPDDIGEDQLPTKLHIVTASVLYSIWENKEQQNKINSIINKISKGELFVSMECLFKDFDYVLRNAKGEYKLVQRNQSTNYLTKYLRQYKGSGRVGEYTIGRLLKDITFSAVGLVDRPANPESIISDKLNLFYNVGYINLDQSHLQENDMTEKVESIVIIEDTPQYKALSAKLEAVQKELETKAKEDKETLKKEKSDADKVISELRATLAKKEEEAEAAEKDKEEKKKFWEKEKADLIEKVNAAEKSKEEMEDKVKCAERVEALMTADSTLTKEKAVELLTKAGVMSDTNFDALISTITHYAAAKPREMTPQEVIASAKASEDANVKYGSNHVSDNELVRSQISSWYKSKSNKGEK